MATHHSSSSSIRRTDVLALAQLREDGRKPHELRRVRIQMGPLLQSPSSGGGPCGSALVEMGLTVALASVRGPTECGRKSDELPHRAVVEATVQSAPFASADRRTSNPATDRRLVEASHLLQRAAEAALLLHLFPKSRIEIVVTILADDGGRLCAAINAASLALADAGLPMRDLVCACTAGYASGANLDTTLVDLNRREEQGGSGGGHQPAVQLPCAVLPRRGTLVLAQCEARLPDYDAFERVLQAAQEGCAALADIMEAAVRDRATTLLRARQGDAKIEDAFAGFK